MTIERGLLDKILGSVILFNGEFESNGEGFSSVDKVSTIKNIIDKGIDVIEPDYLTKAQIELANRPRTYQHLEKACYYFRKHIKQMEEKK